LADGLLIVFTHKPGQLAQVRGQRWQRRHDFVDWRHALEGNIRRLDPFDRNPEQPSPSEPDAKHASPLDFEAGRRPVVEELVGRDRQSYANDGHGIGSSGSASAALRRVKRMCDCAIVNLDSRHQH
jgi:hypothetical protein